MTKWPASATSCGRSFGKRFRLLSFAPFNPGRSVLGWATEWPWRSRYGRRQADWERKLPREWRKFSWHGDRDRPDWPLKMTGQKDWGDPLLDLYLMFFYYCQNVPHWMETNGHQPVLRENIGKMLGYLKDLLERHWVAFFEEWCWLNRELLLLLCAVQDGNEMLVERLKDTEGVLLTVSIPGQADGNLKGTAKGTIISARASIANFCM